MTRRPRADRVELRFTAMDVVSGLTFATIAVGAAGWALLVLFVVCVCRVAARSERIASRLAATDALGRLEDVRSPSGRPFFASRRQRRALVRELSDLHAYV